MGESSVGMQSWRHRGAYRASLLRSTVSSFVLGGILITIVSERLPHQLLSAFTILAVISATRTRTFRSLRPDGVVHASHGLVLGRIIAMGVLMCLTTFTPSLATTLS